MGYYKRLLTSAECGDREAIAEVADHCLARDRLERAVYWFEKIGRKKEAEFCLKEIEERKKPKGGYEFEEVDW